MRPVRSALLFTTAALGAMALLTTSAFAQSVEVIDEATSIHCADDIVETPGHDIGGGCELRMASETPFTTFIHVATGEFTTSICQSALIANINEDGIGYVDVDAATIVEDAATNCFIEPCDEGEAGTTPHADFEWPIASVTEYGASREAAIFTFCIRAHNLTEGSTQTQVCTIETDITLDMEATHTYEIRAAEERCFENPAFEVSVHWLTTYHEDEIAVNHVHYPGDNP